MSTALESLELGICTGPPSPESAAQLRAAGCQYYEPTVARSVMGEDRAAFEAGLGGWSPGGLPPRSANVFLPGAQRVVGEQVDTEGLRRYITEAMRRAGELGIVRVVFGSGDARRVPEGFPREEARRQLFDALRMAADAAATGTVVCLEHLRRAETNIVNSLAEAGEMADELNLDKLGLVVDAYHLQEEDEDPAVIRRFARHIAHVHVCGPKRTPPSEADHERLAGVFAELAAIGYRGRCSIECSWDDLEAQAPAALAAVGAAAAAGGLA